MNSDKQSGVCHASVCLRTGTLLTDTPIEDAAPQLEDLASAAQELLGTSELTVLADMFSRHGSDRRATPQFEELTILSGRRSYVVRRCPDEPERAIAAMSTSGGRLGLVVSTVHSQLKTRSRGA